MPGPYSDVQTGGGGGGITTAQYNALVAQIQTNTREIIANDADIDLNSTRITNIIVEAGEVPLQDFLDLSHAVSSLEARVTTNEQDIANNSTTVINVQTAAVSREEFYDLSGAVFSLTTDVNTLATRVTQNEEDISNNRVIINVLQGDPP